MHKIFMVVGNAWDLMGPDVLLLQGMMRVALRQKVLEEAHVLETEQRNLVMRLMCDLRHRWILALQARLGAVATRRPSLLALDTPSLAVVTTSSTFSMASSLKSLFLSRRSSNKFTTGP